MQEYQESITKVLEDFLSSSGEFLEDLCVSVQPETILISKFLIKTVNSLFQLFNPYQVHLSSECDDSDFGFYSRLLFYKELKPRQVDLLLYPLQEIRTASGGNILSELNKLW